MKTTLKQLSVNELKIFKGYLCETYEYFLFNKIGRDGFERDGIKEFSGIAGEIYYNENFKYIWDVMLRISESGYLSRLANVFDKPTHYDRILKKDVDNIVFCRIEDEFKLVGCEDTIQKIKNTRNKTLDHIDSNTHTYNSGKTLSEVFGLDTAKKDIQLLFDKSFELLRMKKNQEEIERIIKEKFEGWYETFKKGYQVTQGK